MSTPPDADSSESPPLSQRLFERAEGGFAPIQVAAALLVGLPTAALLQGMVGSPVAWLVYPPLIVWLGLEPTWQRGLGKGLYLLAVIVLVLPIWSVLSVVGPETSAVGAGGAAVGGALVAPLVLSVAAVLIGIGYYLRQHSPADGYDFGDTNTSV